MNNLRFSIGFILPPVLVDSGRFFGSQGFFSFLFSSSVWCVVGVVDCMLFYFLFEGPLRLQYICVSDSL